MDSPRIAELIAPTARARQATEHDFLAGFVQQEVTSAAVRARTNRTEMIDMTLGVGFGRGARCHAPSVDAGDADPPGTFVPPRLPATGTHWNGKGPLVDWRSRVRVTVDVRRREHIDR